MASKPPVQQPSGAQRGAGLLGAIAAACACATPLIMESEGLRTKPYLDPVKIPTICYGETQVEMRVYTKDECGALLRQQLGRKYAPKVAACIPGITLPERKHEFAAMIDSAYNAGPVAVCKSRMAAHFRANRWTEGCKSIEGWYVTATYRGAPKPAATMQRLGYRWTGKAWIKQFPGLVTRRKHAASLCLRPER